MCLCARPRPSSKGDDAGQCPAVLYHGYEGSLIESYGDPSETEESETADYCGGDGEEVGGELCMESAGIPERGGGHTGSKPIWRRDSVKYVPGGL